MDGLAATNLAPRGATGCLQSGRVSEEPALMAGGNWSYR
jgi:hypothetical protein